MRDEHSWESDQVTTTKMGRRQGAFLIAVAKTVRKLLVMMAWHFKSESMCG
jgi:hypothetical protein